MIEKNKIEFVIENVQYIINNENAIIDILYFYRFTFKNWKLFVDIVHEFFENFDIKNENIFIVRYILRAIIVKYSNMNEIEFLRNCDYDCNWFEINYFCKREIIDKNNVDDNISKFFVFFEKFFKIDITQVIVFLFFWFFIVVVVIIIIVVIIVVLVIFIDSTFLLFLQFFVFVNLNLEIVKTLVCSMF